MQLDWKEYTALARQAAGEGVVLLRNENKALPFPKGSRISVFGRIQSHYYKSGMGSGGMVNTARVVGILDALEESGDVSLNPALRKVYGDWEAEHPFDAGHGWGTEPWAQTEMPVSPELCREMAAVSDVALVILGRNAGEDKDCQDLEGAYRLSRTEAEMLANVRAAFPSVVVILNTAGLMDLRFVEELGPNAVLMVWQGGMVGGYGVADVLTGKVSPSGKLPDTIAREVRDYPSAADFGGEDRNYYREDIYVGYRYFETVAPEKVLYPFGFGLSYTTFSLHLRQFEKKADSLSLQISVENTGSCPGKEVVQIYGGAPQGKLGKPSRVLLGFQKTRTLAPGETELCTLSIPLYAIASYDDSGVTGHKSCYVLEPGEYHIYAGTDARHAAASVGWVQAEIQVLRKLSENMAPVEPFQRMKPQRQADGSITMGWEPAPIMTKFEAAQHKAELPEALPPFQGEFKLADVAAGKLTLSQFVAQLTDADLAALVRGEGMGSPKVTPGTAAAFGGVTAHLQELGIPCGCCTDGPSGMRLDSGAQAFSLPNGTLLASTFNIPLVEELYAMTGIEMVANHVDILLGPGMNIHRHPLNGRNFEYFSEDPLLTGKMAAAQVRGMKRSGVTGTLKHFCGNNQEARRNFIDDVVSERALREIYLKGFEIAVTEGQADAVMTTYGGVNGVWTAGSFDLNTRILREEWGFQGIVMTDWWAKINHRGTAPDLGDLASMVLAQNDLYMVCPDVSAGYLEGNLLSALEEDPTLRGSAQRCAENICAFLLNSHAYKRLYGTDTPVEILNREERDETVSLEELTYHPIEDGTVIDLSQTDTEKGKSLVLALDAAQTGGYRIEVTGKSDSGELAQIPVTIFYQGTLSGSFQWNGTNGEWRTLEKKLYVRGRYFVLRLYFGQSGLELRDIKFHFEQEASKITDWSQYMG